VRLLAGAVTVITGVLAGAFLVTEWRNGDASLISTTLTFVTTLPNAALFWLVVGALVMRRLLKRRRLSPPALTSADGLLLQMLFAPCLLLYGTSHYFEFSGFPVVLPFLTLFILTRAILVPSSALRTAVLSSTAPIGVLAIQLYYGASFARPGDPYGPDHFIDMLVQNQVILIGAIGVACVASRVNLGLRRRSYETPPTRDRRRELAASVRARGQANQPPDAPECGFDLRLRAHGRWRLLLRHGVARGRQPARDHRRQRPHASGSRHPRALRCLRCPVGGAYQGHGASRYQARDHHAVRARR
jgi:hypothetical protein